MRQVTRVILLNSKNEILLVRHHRDNPWTLPGGHIEEGESIYQAVHREIKEEFNLEIELVGDIDGIAEGRRELIEYVKPINIYEVDFYSKKEKCSIQKLEFIFLGKIVSGDLIVQEEEIYEYKFFSKEELTSGKSDIYPQIIDLVKKHVK